MYQTPTTIPPPSLSQHNYHPYGLQNPNGIFPNPPYIFPNACENSYYFSNQFNNTGVLQNNKTIDQQIERKRHFSYDSYLTKPQQSHTTYQQVPQHSISQTTITAPTQTHLNTNHTEAGNVTSNNLLLMPAPTSTTALSVAQPPPQSASTFATTTTTSGIQRSHSYHAGISTAAYESNQNNNNGPVYVDLYIPHHHGSHQHHHQNNPQYTPANGTQLMVQQPNPPLLMNNSANGLNVSSYSSNCLDNSIG